MLIRRVLLGGPASTNLIVKVLLHNWSSRSQRRILSPLSMFGRIAQLLNGQTTKLIQF